jgi:molybdopterin synthase catalytic subunit
MIELTDQPIDVAGVLAAVQTPTAGAVVMFLGTAREFTDGRRTAALEYEAYREMATACLAELAAQARRQWPLTAAAIVHRLGPVALAEASVAVAVSTPHREDAFQAARWLIDTIKHDVPIWKKEHWADGTATWVHPGLDE